jgi:hypothetical protein
MGPSCWAASAQPPATSLSLHTTSASCTSTLARHPLAALHLRSHQQLRHSYSRGYSQNGRDLAHTHSLACNPFARLHLSSQQQLRHSYSRGYPQIRHDSAQTHTHTLTCVQPLCWAASEQPPAALPPRHPPLVSEEERH